MRGCVCWRTAVAQDRWRHCFVGTRSRGGVRSWRGGREGWVIRVEMADVKETQLVSVVPDGDQIFKVLMSKIFQH